MNAKNSIRSLFSALGICVGMVAVAPAASIGVNFEGGGNGPGPISLLSTDSAGVVPQTNWNNATGSTGTLAAGTVTDSTGNLLPGVSVAYSASGTYSVGQSNPVGGDQKLNDGFIYDNGSVTVSGLTYQTYNVYVYELNDAQGRVETTTLGSTSYYGAAASPQDANHVSGTANTYQYIQSISTDSANPTANGDYVLFTGLTGSTFTFTDSAPGNGYLNGFEIVNTTVPEPGSVVALVGLGGMGLLGLVLRRRRRKA